MDAIVVVDMQVGLLNGTPKYELPAVVDRINALAAKVRDRSGTVIWIQHCGTDDDFRRHSPGWALLPELARDPRDVVVEKRLNDAFAGTDLQATLQGVAADRVLIAGWATDFCVDATIRSAVSHNHHVVVVSDGHTVSDRPHLDAPTVIGYHNWLWGNLLTHRTVRIASTAQLLDENARR